MNLIVIKRFLPHPIDNVKEKLPSHCRKFAEKGDVDQKNTHPSSPKVFAESYDAAGGRRTGGAGKRQRAIGKGKGGRREKRKAGGRRALEVRREKGDVVLYF
jgi:hypothetical protein